MINVLGIELTEGQYIELNNKAQKFYNWNGLSAEQRQDFIKNEILKIKEERA